jgi:hypothetical protein
MKPVKLTAYDSRDRVTTDYARAVGWGHSDKTLPRHGGGCSAAWRPSTSQSFGKNVPDWLVDAEDDRLNAIDKERRND